MNDTKYRLRCTVMSGQEIILYIPESIMNTLEWNDGDKVVLDTIKLGINTTLQIRKEEKEDETQTT